MPAESGRTGGKESKMATENKVSRRKAREAVFGLLYEMEFHPESSAEEIFDRAVADRDIDAEDEYIKSVFFGVCEKLEAVDAIIERHAKGWRTGRLSRVSRAVIRLGVYEMGYVSSIPNTISINEAIELVKKFGEDKARGFVNGVLNAVKDELSGKGVDAPAAAGDEK